MKLKSIALAIGILGAAGSAAAAPVQWAGNGHWYEYISAPTTWDNAYAIANASTFGGMQGYLATITSGDENGFVSFTVAGGNLIWLGGSDAQNEGQWLWVNGPEAGQGFTFTNWYPGEPNNVYIGEDYVQSNWGGATGLWNDHGAPSYGYQANGFVIEYSAAQVSEPATLAMLLSGLGLAGFVARRRKSA